MEALTPKLGRWALRAKRALLDALFGTYLLKRLGHTCFSYLTTITTRFMRLTIISLFTGLGLAYDVTWSILVIPRLTLKWDLWLVIFGNRSPFGYRRI